jgi:hypothetical protein
VSGSHTRQELSFELSSSANRGETRSSQVSAVKKFLFEERQNRLVLRGASIIPRPSCRSRFSMFHGSVLRRGEWSGNVSDPDAVIILSDLRVVVVGHCNARNPALSHCDPSPVHLSLTLHSETYSTVHPAKLPMPQLNRLRCCTTKPRTSKQKHNAPTHAGPVTI